MGNEIYKEQNTKPHPPEVMERILLDLEEFEPYVREGSKTDLCCGNCDIGIHIAADYFYDLYPAYYFVDKLDLGEAFPKTLMSAHPADNVYMFHALEHFENPGHILARIYQFLLNSKGRLYLAVPNAEFTDDENGYLPYDESIGHKFQFNKDILYHILENAGYKVVMIKSVHHDPNLYEILAVAEKP